MNTLPHPNNRWSAEPAAFTLVDLLATIAVILLLASVIAPAFAKTNSWGKTVQCMNNKRRLMAAVLMYSRDNSDLLPPDPDDGNIVPGHDWCAGSLAQEFDSDILADPHLCLVAPYLGGDVQVFRCPADTRVGAYQGPAPAKRGTTVPAARTVSMNGAVGTVCHVFDLRGYGHSGAPTYPVNGPWLDGNHDNKSGHPWLTYRKTSDMLIPTPAQLFVVLDENPLMIDDASFAFSMSQPKWVNFPGIAHDFGCTFGFGDSHAELHNWVDPRTKVLQMAGFIAVPGSPDWLWLSHHASAKAQGPR